MLSPTSRLPTPRQLTLLPSPAISSVTRKSPVSFLEQNKLSASIILQDETRYGGEGALMVEWARKVMGE